LGEKESIEYLIGKHLGKGGFAEVYELNQINTQNKYAVKVIQKNQLKKNRQR